MEFLAFTYTPNAKSIFAPLIETNSFHSKSSDQDDAGYENFSKTLQMARPDDEAILQKLKQVSLEMENRNGIYNALPISCSKADLNRTGVTYATMLDIGNLVADPHFSRASPLDRRDSIFLFLKF